MGSILWSQNTSYAQNQWMELSKPPFDTFFISHVLPLNNGLLIIVRDLYQQLFQIWIYNISKDNYTPLISENNEHKINQFYTASLNDNKSFLYFFGTSGKIIKLNLKTKQIEVSNQSYYF
eukprot:476852_1